MRKKTVDEDKDEDWYCCLCGDYLITDDKYPTLTRTDGQTLRFCGCRGSADGQGLLQRVLFVDEGMTVARWILGGAVVKNVGR